MQRKVSYNCLNRLVLCHVPIPQMFSDGSLTRQEEELDELLDFEELTGVSFIDFVFFTVFCVAVRLHSEKRKDKCER